MDRVLSFGARPGIALALVWTMVSPLTHACDASDDTPFFMRPGTNPSSAGGASASDAAADPGGAQDGGDSGVDMELVSAGCDEFDPAAVYLVVQARNGMAEGAVIVPIMEPAKPCLLIPFDAGVPLFLPIVDRSGRLLYKDRATGDIRAFKADRSRPPSTSWDPSVNDGRVSDTCKQAVRMFRVAPDTDDLLVECTQDERKLPTSDGPIPISSVYARGANGIAFAQLSTGRRIIDKQGEVVQTEPFLQLNNAIAWRAHEDGFRFVMPELNAARDNRVEVLYFVRPDGTWVTQGEFGPSLGASSMSKGVLSGAGVLYQETEPRVGPLQIVRRSVGGEAFIVVTSDDIERLAGHEEFFPYGGLVSGP